MPASDPAQNRPSVSPDQARSPALNLGYYWGDDEFGLDRRADRLGERVGAAEGTPLETYRTRGDRTSPNELAERVGTALLFGGGTLVVVSDPGPLLRSDDGRLALLGVLRLVAPGNALAFLQPVDGPGREPARSTTLREAIQAAGGEVAELKAPREGQMARWIEERARERSVRLGPGAAQELATRIGAFVREGDVDRRRQGYLAVGELEKLRLYRPDAPVSVEDVRALVPEVIPGSTWAFLDAVATRRAPAAAEVLDRLLETVPPQVLVAVLHRRIRELIVTVGILASNGTPAAIIKALRIKPYPAEKLVEQAPGWTIPNLEAALSGLLDLDVLVKGGDGQATDGQVRLGFALWVSDNVARRAPRAGSPPRQAR